MPRPRTGQTPIRHVRLPDDIWDRVIALAEQTGRTRTDIVAAALERYLKSAKR